MWVAFLPCLLFQHHSLHGYVDSQKAQAPFRFIISVFWMRSLWRERAKQHEPHKMVKSHTCQKLTDMPYSMPTPTTGYRHLILYCGLSWVLGGCGGLRPVADGRLRIADRLYMYRPHVLVSSAVAKACGQLKAEGA